MAATPGKPTSYAGQFRRRVPLSGRALDAHAGIDQRWPYQLRHTFATEALAAGISIFELARLMGTSVKMIDRAYGHLASPPARPSRTA